MFDWSFYKPSATKNPAWVPEKTIFLTRAGSVAYGTNTPSSDLDIRGVCIAPIEHYHSFRYCEAPGKFEQIVLNEPNDLVIFELRKFLILAAQSNPNCTEIIFTDKIDHLFFNELGSVLLENRNLFLSKRCRYTYGGYAAAQISRMKLHYSWNHNENVQSFPKRESFGLKQKPEIPQNQLDAAFAAVSKKVDQWNLLGLQDLDPHLRILLQTKMSEMLVEAEVSTDNLWQGAARVLGFEENFILYIQKEKEFKAAIDNYNNHKIWLKNRNPSRAELEKRVGFDAKNGANLVRLLRQCEELLSTGKLNVKRKDAQELLEIKNGSWSYEKILEFADEQKIILDSLMKTSPLPENPDYESIDKLGIYLVEKSF